MLIIKEVCVDTLKNAIEAEKNGADRIELCSRLDLEGLTPKKILIDNVMNNLKIPVRVMIRNIHGTFIYKKNDLKMMVEQIEYCKSIGVDGVVFGCLKENHHLDMSKINFLTKISKPLKVIIHKAIDETPSPLESLKMILKNKKINGILSSGGKKKAISSVVTLKKMLDLVNSDFELIFAGGITHNNLFELHSKLNGTYYHGKKIINF